MAAADRGAQPQQLWRHGQRFLRSEDTPDPARGNQSIIVIAEPHIWAYDPAAQQGRHALDPDPKLIVHAPIIPPAPGLPGPIAALEFGCEAEFVATYAPDPQRTVPWGGGQASVHTMSIGDHTVAILMETRRKAPLMLSYLMAGQPRFVIRYDEYLHGLPDQPGLFEPPKAVKMVEAGVQPPPRPPGP